MVESAYPPGGMNIKSPEQVAAEYSHGQISIALKMARALQREHFSEGARQHISVLESALRIATGGLVDGARNIH